LVWQFPWNSRLSERTSFNGNIRKQYAGIGYTYDPVNDVFIAPQPYGSWTLDENFDWQPPTPMPAEEGKVYTWFEPNLKPNRNVGRHLTRWLTPQFLSSISVLLRPLL
jgi:hypothetical protein